MQYICSVVVGSSSSVAVCDRTLFASSQPTDSRFRSPFFLLTSSFPLEMADSDPTVVATMFVCPSPPLYRCLFDMPFLFFSFHPSFVLRPF